MNIVIQSTVDRQRINKLSTSVWVFGRGFDQEKIACQLCQRQGALYVLDRLPNGLVGLDHLLRLTTSM